MAKHCPSCGGFFLYDDSQETCPDCGRVLVPYRRAEAAASGPSSASHNQASGSQSPLRQPRTAPAENTRPAFLTQEGGQYIFRGAVFHVDTLVREYGFFRKLFYSVFAGEPFQMGRVSYLANIRLEEHTDVGFPEQRQTLTYYGDIESQLDTGDDIQVTCVQRRGRYMARQVYSFDYNRPVVPETVRIPAWLVRILFFGILFFLFGIASAIVDFFASGAFMALISQLMLPAILLGGLWFWLRSRRRW